MAHDFVEAGKAKIRELEAAIAAIQASLRAVGGLETDVLEGGQPKRKPTSWKVADAIERILEKGAKTMKRDDLIQVLVDQSLVGGPDADEEQRRQYAKDAIDRGKLHKYLKEAPDTTIHWLPGIRKSRVSKKL
jgi:hypothetical protein